MAFSDKACLATTRQYKAFVAAMVDVPTLLGYTTVVLLCLSLLVLVARPQAGKRLWLAMPFFAGACGCAFLIQPQAFPGRLGLQLGAFCITLAYAFGWQAIRAFYDRPPRWGWLLLPALLWLGLAIAVFDRYGWAMANAGLRVGLVCLYSALPARELWRRRNGGLPSARLLAIVFGVAAGLAALAVAFAHWLPQPLGAAPAQTWAVVFYNVRILLHVLLASALLVAMHKERDALRYYDDSVRDPMTGLYNRRFFEQRAEQWRDRGARRRSVLFFDIDHFKRINDRHGHRLGDAVIVLAAQVAQRSLRKGDWIFRFGGEEFVCVLPDTDLAQANAMAERLRLAFMADAREVEGRRIDATISIGVATSVGGVPRIDALVAEADRMLYRAKAAGRNRVVSSINQDPLPTGS
ncbi:Diguanylate cyclase, GGDEF domain [Xanthomonas sp. GW]|uniref:GGDEF domain-containing protein n=1 Tax=Xanthomonas sp. GW TaxID=2724121 RepID=UPI00163B4E98|nr:GGDEF domain-containing protein [Xanthomonas sp. GW]QNH21731.1 Diguanylate cyclase, GGDEF domain [Xanthomonas sp. GW]